MVRIFEWLANKFRTFNNWFKKNWNNLVKNYYLNKVYNLIHYEAK